MAPNIPEARGLVFGLFFGILFDVAIASTIVHFL